jgi:DNA-directed RNA polymerase specialized sigma24 family protein
VGPVRQPMPRETRAGAGPAFENAREAVERAKHSPGRVAVSAPPPASWQGPPEAGGEEQTMLLEAVEAGLQLLAELEFRRSDEGQDAGRLVDAGLTQREAAEQLGITQQAVSSRLRSGLWHETRRLASVAAHQLAGLDAGLAGDRSGQGGAR